MKNRELMKIVLLSYLIGTGGSFLISLLRLNLPISESFISSIKVSTILTIWWWFYFKFGWKVPVLNKYLYKINLVWGI